MKNVKRVAQLAAQPRLSREAGALSLWKRLHVSGVTRTSRRNALKQALARVIGEKQKTSTSKAAHVVKDHDDKHSILHFRWEDSRFISREGS
jgi:hypothetical protein